MNKWVKKLLPSTKTLTQSTKLIGLKKTRYNFLYHLDEESFCRGIAIGLFAGMIPLLPFQTLLAILVCILLRGNIVVAFAISWISNPITILPLTYATYAIGDWILVGSAAQTDFHEINWKVNSIQSLWSALSAWFSQFGLAFFVGLPVIAIGSAGLGYIIAKFVWRVVHKTKTRH